MGSFQWHQVRPIPKDDKAVTKEEQDAMDTYDKNERSAKSLLTQKIPDSTLIRLRTQSTVASRWAAIITEYTQKGTFAQTELRTQFLESKCPDKGNVRTFLEDLDTKRESLATVGVEINEDDYRSTMIRSLPPYLSTFASNQLAAARVAAILAKKDFIPPSPDILRVIICEESDRSLSQRARKAEKSKSDGKDEALSVQSGDKEKKRKRPLSEITCWNCNEKGHFRSKCPKPEQKKFSSSNTKSSSNGKEKGNSAAVAESDSDEEGVFAADDIGLSDCESLPDLQYPSDVDSDTDDEEHIEGDDKDGDKEGEDWFSEVDEDDMAERDLQDEVSSWDHIPRQGTTTQTEDESSDISDIAANVHTDLPTSTSTTEVYDSGCTRHISPYHRHLEDYTEIPPKIFRAANKESFKAVGKGELVIDVPNGVEETKL